MLPSVVGANQPALTRSAAYWDGRLMPHPAGYADLPFGTEHAEAPGAFRRVTSDRIIVINAIQSTVGAYLSSAQIEDVATAVLAALQRR